ncbi:conserved hypothetical protein [Candidatus Magnetomoraceae bacterium gMMP-15]
MQKPSIPPKKSSVKIKLFIVRFDFKIERRRIPAFRGAVIEKAGRENLLFHNHLNQKFRYGYPLIQYKSVNKNPTIVCIDQGAEDILKFFQQDNWDLVIHDQKIKTRIKHVFADYFECKLSPKPLNYRIHNWFALNEKNFNKFIILNNQAKKAAFLERILIGNILTFAKGINWNIDGQVEVKISDLPKIRSFSFKNHQMVGFDIDFTSNIILPEFIGLGKSVSRGFGMIKN